MSEFWKIEENVGPGYIVLPPTFATMRQAEVWMSGRIEAGMLDPRRCRVAKYRTCTGSAGPVRVE